MGVRFSTGSSGAIVNPLPAGAAETIVCTSAPLIPTLDNQLILLLVTFGITAGASTTAIVLNIRRGTLITSPPIFAPAPSHTLAAGNSAIISLAVADQPGAAAAVQYSLTVSQTAATVAGTITALEVFALAL